MNKQQIEKLKVNDRSLAEFTADKMYELSVSYQLLNNQKFRQLVEEILFLIEKLAKSGEFILSLAIPNTQTDETLYQKIKNFLSCLGYDTYIIDKYQLSGEDAKNNHLIIEWKEKVLPY